MTGDRSRMEAQGHGVVGPMGFTAELVGELDTSLNEQEGKVRLALAKVQARVEPHTWQGFVLTTFENMTAREAAERTGQSIAAIHVAKNRIRKMLQEELDNFNVA